MPARNAPSRDFQDNVLSRIVEQRQIATIYLRNRMSLRGRVTEFDPYVLMLEPLDGGPVQMVYKSSIVSISGPRTLGGRPSGPPRGGGGGRYPSDGPRPPRHYGNEEGGSGGGYPREGERYSREGGPREGGPYPPREGGPYPPRETRPEGSGPPAEGHPPAERPFRFRPTE